MARASTRGSKQAKAVTPTAAAQRTRRGRGQGDPIPEQRLDDPEALIRKANRVTKARKGSASRRKPSQKAPKESTASRSQSRQGSQQNTAVSVPEVSSVEETPLEPTENNDATEQPEQQPLGPEVALPETEQSVVASRWDSVPNGEIDSEAQVDGSPADDKKRKRNEDTEDEESTKRPKIADEEFTDTVEREIKPEPEAQDDAQLAISIPTEAKPENFPTTPTVPPTPPPTSRISSQVPESSMPAPAVIPTETPRTSITASPAIPTPPSTAVRTGSFLGSLLDEFGGAPIGWSDHWRPPGRMTRRPSWEGQQRTNSQQAREHTNQAREFQGLPTESPKTSLVPASRPRTSCGQASTSDQPATTVPDTEDDGDTSDEEEDAPTPAQQASLRDRLLATTEGPKTLGMKNQDSGELGGADDNDTYSPPDPSSGLTLAQLVDLEQQRHSPDLESSAARLEQQLEAALNRGDTPEAPEQRPSTQQTERSVAASDHPATDDEEVVQAFQAAGDDFSHTDSATTPPAGFSQVFAPPEQAIAPRAPMQAYDYQSNGFYDEEEDQVDYGDDDDDFDAIYHV